MAAFMEVCTNPLPGRAGVVPCRASGSCAWLQLHQRFTVATESTVPFSSPRVLWWPPTLMPCSVRPPPACLAPSQQILPMQWWRNEGCLVMGHPHPSGHSHSWVLALLCTVLQAPHEAEGDGGVTCRDTSQVPHRSSALRGQGVRVPAFPGQSPRGSLRCGTGTIVPQWHPLDRAHPSGTLRNRSTIDLTESCPRMNVSRLLPVFVSDKCLRFSSHPPSSWGLLCCDNLLFHCDSVRCLKRIIGRYFCSLDVKK